MTESEMTDQTPLAASISGGSNSVTSGNGNVVQTVNVEPARQGMTVTVIVPIVAAIISGIGGAWASHELSLSRAPTKTVDQTETLLGIARDAIGLAQSTKAAPEVLVKLEELQSQARAVQANVQLLLAPTDGASFLPDFWLAMGKGAVLGGTTAFGITAPYRDGGIWVRINNQNSVMKAGSRLDYKVSGKTCHVNYLGSSSDGTLFGFKTVCET